MFFLYCINPHQVISEALAGTRPRGSTSEEDAELLRDLMYSKKDLNENMITGRFIKDAFNELKDENLLESYGNILSSSVDPKENFFIRRLRHLQHICQSFEGKMMDKHDAIGKCILIVDSNYS